jgi:hypothetical protein
MLFPTRVILLCIAPRVSSIFPALTGEVGVVISSLLFTRLSGANDGVQRITRQYGFLKTPCRRGYILSGENILRLMA